MVLTYWSVIGIFYITIPVSLFLNLSLSFCVCAAQMCAALAMILWNE